MSEEVQEGELEVRTYSISSPDMLEVMLDYTDLLEKASRGEISVNEAKSLYAQKILPIVEELKKKYAPREVKKKKSSSKKRKKKSKG